MTEHVDFAVIFDHLATDAQTWREVCEGVTAAKSAAAGVEEIPFLVTDGIGYAAGFKDTYEKLATWTVDFLAEGETAMTGIATRLDETKVEFETSEDYAQWLANGGS